MYIPHGCPAVQRCVCWRSYRSRYEAASPAHHLLDAFEGLVTAAAVHNIVADLTAFELVHMYAFLTFVILGRLCLVLRNVELWWTAGPEGNFANVRWTSANAMQSGIIDSLVLCLGFFMRSAVSVFVLMIFAWLLSSSMLYVPIIMVMMLSVPTPLPYLGLEWPGGPHCRWALTRASVESLCHE